MKGYRTYLVAIITILVTVGPQLLGLDWTTVLGKDAATKVVFIMSVLMILMRSVTHTGPLDDGKGNDVVQ